MNTPFWFKHKETNYCIDWEEEDKILTLSFSEYGGELIKEYPVKLLGSIDQEQLNDIVTDHKKHFVKTVLKDLEI